MERKGSAQQPDRPRRTLRDIFFGSCTPKVDPQIDEEPGYYIRGGDWPSHISGPNIPREQLYRVLAKFNEVYPQAMADLAATPVDPEDEDYARGDNPPERQAMVVYIRRIYPDAMRDLAETSEEPSENLSNGPQEQGRE